MKSYLNEVVFLSERDCCNRESYKPTTSIRVMAFSSVSHLVQEKMVLACGSSERQYGRHHFAPHMQRPGVEDAILGRE